MGGRHRASGVWSSRKPEARHSQGRATLPGHAWLLARRQLPPKLVPLSMDVHQGFQLCPSEEGSVPVAQHPVQYPANGVGDGGGEEHEQAHKGGRVGADL